MQFALLFYNPPHTEIPEAERAATVARGVAEMSAWYGEMRSAGVIRSGMRLAPVDAAVSLRMQGDEPFVTDGPFAETKEILGGFVLIECASRDEALAWAKRCPILRFGTVEVRPEWGAQS
jgi:hypothetical protein